MLGNHNRWKMSLVCEFLLRQVFGRTRCRRCHWFSRSNSRRNFSTKIGREHGNVWATKCGFRIGIEIWKRQFRSSKIIWQNWNFVFLKKIKFNLRLVSFILREPNTPEPTIGTLPKSGMLFVYQLIQRRRRSDCVRACTFNLSKSTVAVQSQPPSTHMYKLERARCRRVLYAVRNREMPSIEWVTHLSSAHRKRNNEPSTALLA